MNIFILDTDPHKAAAYHCDKHVVKMILESTQILSTVMNINGLKGPYKSTHINHPCVKWASESRDNYKWLYRLLGALFNEYHKRYFPKVHACSKFYSYLTIPDSIPDKGPTPFVQCMPEQYRNYGDPVMAYRNYYLNEKRSFAKWKLGNIPEWWNMKASNEDEGKDL